MRQNYLREFRTYISLPVIPFSVSYVKLIRVTETILVKRISQAQSTRNYQILAWEMFKRLSEIKSGCFCDVNLEPFIC